VSEFKNNSNLEPSSGTPKPDVLVDSASVCRLRRFFELLDEWSREQPRGGAANKRDRVDTGNGEGTTTKEEIP
jgi:hypothetical protein